MKQYTDAEYNQLVLRVEQKLFERAKITSYDESPFKDNEQAMRKIIKDIAKNAHKALSLGYDEQKTRAKLVDLISFDDSGSTMSIFEAMILTTIIITCVINELKKD